MNICKTANNGPPRDDIEVRHFVIVWCTVCAIVLNEEQDTKTAPQRPLASSPINFLVFSNDASVRCAAICGGWLLPDVGFTWTWLAVFMRSTASPEQTDVTVFLHGLGWDAPKKCWIRGLRAHLLHSFFFSIINTQEAARTPSRWRCTFQTDTDPTGSHGSWASWMYGWNVFPSKYPILEGALGMTNYRNWRFFHGSKAILKNKVTRCMLYMTARSQSRTVKQSLGTQAAELPSK